MGSQTSLFAIPYPLGTDRVMDGDDAMKALAQRVEDRIGGALVALATTASGDYAAAGGNIFNVNVAMLAGHRYRISATVMGQQITTAATVLLSRVSVGGTELGRPLMESAAAVNQVLTGSATVVFVAASSSTLAVVLFISSNAGAFRVGVNQAHLIVEDLGAF